MGDTPFKILTKLWISDQSGHVIFGMGRVKILEAIEQHGSINAAAQHLKMSYRAAWGKIKVTEERLGHDLIVRKAGGTKGGGSELTAYAKNLIAEFKALHRQILDLSDQRFDKRLLGKLSEK